MQPELRYCSSPVSVSRASARAGGTGSMIQGHAAVYWNEKDPGTQYELGPGVFERIRPGAFDEAIKSDTVVCVFNHDNNEILGKNTAKTLTLRTDKVGLVYECETPPTSDGEKVLVAVRRGDVSGSSFAFAIRPGGQTWDEETDSTGQRITIRWLTKLKLYDVSPVVMGAYASATVTIGGTGPRSTPSRLDDILRGKHVDPRAEFYKCLTRTTARARELQESMR